MNIDAWVWWRGYQTDCGELNLRTRLYSEQLQRGVTETGLQAREAAREDRN